MELDDTREAQIDDKRSINKIPTKDSWSNESWQM